jgi:hypothetical protein
VGEASRAEVVEVDGLAEGGAEGKVAESEDWRGRDEDASMALAATRGPRSAANVVRLASLGPGSGSATPSGVEAR